MTEQNEEISEKKQEKAVVAGGCFWCMQPPYENLPGVTKVTVGYSGGSTSNPSYKEVCSGESGHVEAVEILFNPQVTSFRDILEVYWKNIDPTNALGQFADIGPQYRTVIFYHTDEQRKIAQESKDFWDSSGKFKGPIATQILPAKPFYAAELGHQAYYKKNPQRYEAYKEGSGRAAFLRDLWNSEKE